MKKQTSAQSIIEYLVFLTLILAVILSSGFIDRIRNAFIVYFDKAVSYLK